LDLSCVPFVPFDAYMLCDDSPTYPMTCHIRFWFDRCPDRSQFTNALIAALQRHPLLSAHSRTRSFWRLPAFDLKPVNEKNIGEVFDFREDDEILEVRPMIQPDIRTRFFVRKACKRPYQLTSSIDASGNGYIFIVQFHHAVSDGIGIFNFFEDLIELYAGQEPSQRRDARSLLGRGTYHLTLPKWIRRLKYDWERYRLFFKSRAESLFTEGPVSQAAAPIDAYVRRIWTKEEMKTFAADAKARGVTVNDLLVTRYFMSLAAWQKQKPIWKKGIRISVPMNLRLPEDDIVPAANIVSMVFLDRGGELLNNETELLKTVVTEMLRIKECRQGLAMVRLMDWFVRVPGLMPLYFSLPICQATSVLTNLGRPFHTSNLMGKDGLLKAGDITLQSVDTLPPVRKLTAISLSVNSYGGRFSMTLRYDARVMQEESAIRLIDLVSTTIRG